jgi:hypothetical protein
MQILPFTVLPPVVVPENISAPSFPALSAA